VSGAGSATAFAPSPRSRYRHDCSKQNQTWLILITGPLHDVQILVGPQVQRSSAGVSLVAQRKIEGRDRIVIEAIGEIKPRIDRNLAIPIFSNAKGLVIRVGRLDEAPLRDGLDRPRPKALYKRGSRSFPRKSVGENTCSIVNSYCAIAYYKRLAAK
jgi:hypothetical protein